MASELPPTVVLDAIPPGELGHILAQASDLLVVLDNEMKVTAATPGTGFDRHLAGFWIGVSFDELVTSDSHQKIPLLLADASTGTGSRVWRHLNIRVGVGSDIPFLLKAFPVGDGYLLVGRDLRPIRDAQRLVQKEQANLERQRQNLEDAGVTLGTETFVSSVGTVPLSQIVADMVGYLVRRCAREAVAMSEGDHDKAAKLLRVSKDQLREWLA